MHSITGIYHIDYFLGVAIDDGDLSGITQCYGENIIDVVIV